MKTKTTALLFAVSVLLAPFTSGFANAQTGATTGSEGGAPTTTAPANTTTGQSNDTNTAAAPATDTNAQNNAATTQPVNNTSTDSVTTSNTEHTGVNPLVWVLVALVVIGGIALAMNKRKQVSSSTVVRKDQTTVTRTDL